MVFGIIAGVASAALGFAGAESSSKAANKAAEKQYEYDKEVWEYNWEESNRQYDFNKESNQIARQNNENELGWRESTALNDWAYGMKIRDYEYLNDMTQYTVGEYTYQSQLDLNSSAVASAMDLENRWFHEQMIENVYADKDVLMSLGQLTVQEDLRNLQGNTEINTNLNQLITGENLKNIQGNRDISTGLSQLVTSENLKYLQGFRDTNIQMAQEMDSTFLNSEALNQQQRTERADAAFRSLDNMVAGLQSAGQARNAGNAGRSQAKAVQSAMASVGRTQAQIVDSLTRSDAKYSLERRGMAQKLTQSLQTSNNAKRKLTENRLRTVGQARQTAANQRQALDENRTLTVGQAQQTASRQKDVLSQNRTLAVGQATQSANFNREVLSKQLESVAMRTVSNREKILQDRYQADMDAFAKRMIEPTLAPDLPVPYQLPRTVFQDPIKPKKPPKPIKGAGGASTATNLLSAGAGLASSLGSIQW